MSSSLDSLYHPKVPDGLRKLEASLLGVERTTDLLGSFRPSNLLAEKERVATLLSRKEVALPQFRYRALPDLRGARDVLTAARIALSASSTESWEPIRVLLNERLEELSLELRMVAARGDSQMPEYSKERYRYSSSELRAAEEEAFRYVRLPAGGDSPLGPPPQEEICLATFLSQEVTRRGLSVRVLEREISSVAAVGDDCLLVRRGARVQPREAARIFEHEVFAHLLPRARGRGGVPPLSIGTAGSSEDEEGRAILIEERAGLLTVVRKKEIAIRFLLASAMRELPERAAERARELCVEGCSPGSVATALCRVLRGGGLGREIAYVASFLRVKTAQERGPELEALMQMGRISVRGAPVFQSFLNSMTTGA